jgi:DNA-binding CsgD family transcriptional regulator
VQGRLPDATVSFSAALRLYEEAGDAWGAAFALQGLGVQAVLATEYERATALYVEALSRFRVIGDPWGIGGTLMNLGCLVGDTGDAVRGEQLLRESLPPLRQAGDADRLGRALVNLGEYAAERGDGEEAETFLSEGLAMLRQLGQREVIAYALGILGTLAAGRGDTARAMSHLAESLRLCREIGARHWTAQTLERLAAVVVSARDATLAARLLGAADALRAATGRRVPPAEQGGVEATAAAARGALGEIAFATAEAAGRAQPDAAIAAVLAHVSEAAAGAPFDRDTQLQLVRIAGPRLTPREREVLALLVAGQRDPQIGAALSISPRTVESHVAAILAKLAAPSRTAAVAHAVRHNLV